MFPLVNEVFAFLDASSFVRCAIAMRLPLFSHPHNEHRLSEARQRLCECETQLYNVRLFKSVKGYALVGITLKAGSFKHQENLWLCVIKGQKRRVQACEEDMIRENGKRIRFS